MYIQETLDKNNYVVCYSNPPESQFFPMHFHDGYEFLYISNGGGVCFIEGEKYEFSSGDIIITNPNELHSIETDKNTERWRLSFRPFFLAEFIDTSYNPLQALQNRKVGTQNLIPAKIVKKLGLDVSMNNVRRLNLTDSPEKELLIKANLLIMLNAIGSVFKKTTSTPEHKLTKIISFVNEHFTENITVEDIAHHFFLSKSMISHMFSKSMGIPLKNYITYKKLIYAKELLMTEKKLTEICLDVGFNDYSVFCRAFKKAMGVSPSDYRKMIN